MSWYNTGSSNPFEGLMNGSGGNGSVPTTEIPTTLSGEQEIPFLLPGTEGLTDNFLSSTNKIRSLGDNGTGEASVSAYMASHPGASYEEVMEYMASQSDEWAEKYLDYLAEKGEIDRANEYTASREDTAYQRLVADLKSAGLNPAMLFGSSASPSSAGAVGYTKLSEGANSRSVGNYSKLKNLILAYMKYEFDKSIKISNTAMSGFKAILSLIDFF